MSDLPVLVVARIWCRRALMNTEQLCYLCFGAWDRKKATYHKSLIEQTMRGENEKKLRDFMAAHPPYQMRTSWIRDKRINLKKMGYRKLQLVPGKLSGKSTSPR